MEDDPEAKRQKAADAAQKLQSMIEDPKQSKNHLILAEYETETDKVVKSMTALHAKMKNVKAAKVAKGEIGLWIKSLEKHASDMGKLSEKNRISDDDLAKWTTKMEKIRESVKKKTKLCKAFS